MKHEDFEKILEERFRKSRKVLVKKSKEYSKGNDKLHNFKVAAQYDNEAPEKALWGMLKKHLVSVQDMINDPESVTEYLIDEKIGDSCNYLHLLEALFRERLKEK